MNLHDTIYIHLNTSQMFSQGAHTKRIEDVFAASKIQELPGAEKTWQAFSSRAVAIETQRPKPTTTEITKETCNSLQHRHIISHYISHYINKSQLSHGNFESLNVESMSTLLVDEHGHRGEL